MSGIILCGFGLGSFIFTFIAQAIANPNDLEEITLKVPGGGTVNMFPRQVGENVIKH